MVQLLSPSCSSRVNSVDLMSATLQRLPIQGRSPQQQLLVETTGHRPPLRARARARSSTNKNKKIKLRAVMSPCLQYVEPRPNQL